MNYYASINKILVKMGFASLAATFSKIYCKIAAISVAESVGTVAVDDFLFYRLLIQSLSFCSFYGILVEYEQDGVGFIIFQLEQISCPDFSSIYGEVSLSFSKLLSTTKIKKDGRKQTSLKVRKNGLRFHVILGFTSFQVSLVIKLKLRVSQIGIYGLVLFQALQTLRMSLASSLYIFLWKRMGMKAFSILLLAGVMQQYYEFVSQLSIQLRKPKKWPRQKKARIMLAVSDYGRKSIVWRS